MCVYVGKGSKVQTTAAATVAAIGISHIVGVRGEGEGKARHIKGPCPHRLLGVLVELMYAMTSAYHSRAKQS